MEEHETLINENAPAEMQLLKAHKKPVAKGPKYRQFKKSIDYKIITHFIYLFTYLNHTYVS